MPRVSWGIDSGIVDDWDRDSQYTPYTGSTPPNAVYQWLVKVAKYAAPTDDKYPQLRLGFELTPRNKDEQKYKGFFIMKYMVVMEKNAFVYTPFLDAIGASGRDFTRRTITDEEGNVKKIGNWRNDGKTLVLGQLQDDTDQNGNSRKAISWLGPIEETEEEEEEYDDEGGFEEE